MELPIDQDNAALQGRKAFECGWSLLKNPYDPRMQPKCYVAWRRAFLVERSRRRNIEAE